MPKASEVATELRRLADSLDKSPDAIVVKPWVHFMAQTKQSFVDTVRILPRPLTKKVSDSGNSWAKLRVTYVNDAIDLDCSVDQSLCCILVKPAAPAVYECPPILSDDEAANLIL